MELGCLRDLKSGNRKWYPVNNFGLPSHYLNLVGVSERILSVSKKSRIFENAILKIQSTLPCKSLMAKITSDNSSVLVCCQE